MNDTTTIRTELEDFIQRNGLTYSQLGKNAGLNAGTVSSILTGNRVMAVDQLDRMTSVLELPSGHFYEQYIQECMIEAVPNWRRIRPLLYNCAELDKLDCIRQIVQLLLDNLTYSPLLFEVAEDFFQTDKHAAAAILYESVATSERRQHSERLAFCQYRLFTLRLGDNQELNLRAALQFEPFVDRLDIIDQLDALKDLANTYRSLLKWDKVDEVAQEMEHKATIQLFMPDKLIRKGKEPQKKPIRPLFVYLTFSNLLRGSVCDARGDYELALQYTYTYVDLSWVKEKDEETLHWVNLFIGWAQANIYVAKLLSGDVSVLSDYVSYIEQNTDEILTGLLNITKAANRFDIDIDNILRHFEPQIISYVKQQQQATAIYTQQVISEQIASFFYEIAHYYLSKELYLDGFKYLLDSMEKSVIISDETHILKSVRLFERFREFASHETESEYQNLLIEEENK
ncbi:transcriptional regulator with XRE-family HTH domain [Paenibacillus sp. DS2015]|uniref:transcriptional regulator n=1 Tax=Paenibacillus sp. DS2015 TaxID=3373917 RepID=UPI003D21C87A